jgi:isoquinoline 1-oxidoreductase alpha subunit
MLGGLYLAPHYGRGTYWIPAARIATLAIMLVGLSQKTCASTGVGGISSKRVCSDVVPMLYSFNPTAFKSEKWRGVGGSAVMVTFFLNGSPRSFNGDPQMPLLWVLRDVLNLTGTKYGCGMALCGACTVLVDGEATRSCVTTIASTGSKHITTVEGLSVDSSHPLQRAWVELDVPQCGYCQSGQLMSAAALLSKKPNPTDADIDEMMSGNICRCGTYGRIRQAIHRAAEQIANHGDRRKGG